MINHLLFNYHINYPFVFDKLAETARQNPIFVTGKSLVLPVGANRIDSPDGYEEIYIPNEGNKPPPEVLARFPRINIRRVLTEHLSSNIYRFPRPNKVFWLAKVDFFNGDSVLYFFSNLGRDIDLFLFYRIPYELFSKFHHVQ